MPSVKQEILHKPTDSSHHEGANVKKTANEEGAYVYTIFDNKGYIIASVVLGEAQGSTTNYILPLSGAKSERKESGSTSRSASDDIYYWEFDAVVNGEKTTLTVKSKYENVFTGQQTVELNKYMPVEVRYDGDYVTEIKTIDPNKIFTDNSVERKIGDMKIYDVGCVLGKEWTVADNGMTTIVDPTASALENTELSDRAAHRLDGRIELQRRTLYVERDHQYPDVGLALAEDAKAVLIQPENGKITETNCASVEEALGRLADRDRDADGKQFKGRIMAVLNSNGVAQWLVIFSDSNLVTGNDPNYNNYNGNVSITNSEKDMLYVLNGSKIEVLRTGTSRLTLNLDAPDWADVNNGAGNLKFTATLMMDGRALDYVDFTSAAAQSVVSNHAANIKLVEDGTTHKMTFTGSYDNAFTQLSSYLWLNMLNGSFDYTDHDFAIVISNIHWDYAGVKYVLANSPKDETMTGLTQTLTGKLSTDSASAVKTDIFAFDAAAAATAKYTVKDPTYNITGVTRCSGEAVATSGKIENTDAIKFPTGGIYANGNGWVTVTIGGVTAPKTTTTTPGSNPQTGSYSVESKIAATANKPIEFAVVSEKPANKAALPAASEWKTSLTKVADGSVILVRSAKSGAPMKNSGGLTAANIFNMDAFPQTASAATPKNDITGDDTVYYFTMPKCNVGIKDVALDEVVAKHGTIVINGITKDINILTEEAPSALDTDAKKLDFAYDWINGAGSVYGWSAAKNRGYVNDVLVTTGLTLTKGEADPVSITVSELNIAENKAYVRVIPQLGAQENELQYVVMDGTTAPTVKAALASAGCGLSNDNLHVMIVGNDGAGSTSAQASTYDTAATNKDVIVTNGTAGYIKLTDTTPVTAAANIDNAGTAITGFTVAAALDTVADADGFKVSDTQYVKPGATLTITLNASKADQQIAAGYNVSAQIAATTGTDVTVGGTYATAQPVAALAAGSAFSNDSNVKLTFTLSNPQAATVSAILVTLTEAAVS